MEKCWEKRTCSSLSGTVTVTFHDVAACFEEEDWELMKQWQQDLYRDAMKEIHSALHNLGYRILNPYLLVKIEKHRERFRNNHSQSTTEETSSGLSPNKTRPLSKSPWVGEAQELATRHRSRRRKGIARQIKPVAALHDFDQNKQTEPKENEVPCVFSDCEVSFSGVQRSFPLEEICPYLSPVKGFREDAPIGFQERGQAFILCSVCSKTFCNNSSFQVHMQSHTERPFKCTDCDKSFIRSSHLKIHLRTHTGERPYKCTVCEKSFRDNSSYARHQRIHTGEKPYQCSICGKYFRKKSNLRDHYRTHTGERPYKCQHCDKSFHQRNHQADSC